MKPIKLSIPTMDSVELRDYCKQIIPLIIEDDKFYEQDMTNVDYERSSLVWEPVKGREIPERELELLTDIKVLSEYGHPSLYKPSLGEIVRQIPLHYLNETVYVSTRHTDNITNFSEYEQEALKQGFHVVYCTLFAKYDKRTEAELVGVNYVNQEIRVKHSELQKVGSSKFMRWCPTCKKGILPVKRDCNTQEIIEDRDTCTLCAQDFFYIDADQIGR